MLVKISTFGGSDENIAEVLKTLSEKLAEIAGQVEDDEDECCEDCPYANYDE